MQGWTKIRTSTDFFMDSTVVYDGIVICATQLPERLVYEALFSNSGYQDSRRVSQADREIADDDSDHDDEDITRARLSSVLSPKFF